MISAKKFPTRALDKRITIEQLKVIEPETYFDYMSKAVVDTGRELIAVNAELNSDLESLLLENGSEQRNLYGINILFDEREIEFDSMINPPRNREAGYPRAGRTVADPEARKRIEEVVSKWIEM